jgi:hypothetical protein
MIIDNDYNYSQIITMEDSITYYQATIDTIKQTLQLTFLSQRGFHFHKEKIHN